MDSLTDYANKLWSLINQAKEDGFSVMVDRDEDLLLVDNEGGRTSYFGSVSND